ncbi:MAG TPA: hypothetical protein VJY62_10965 [Bacteroidia bacterium]|nr:hypothetical protein [Bacteroidia bacterium]
MRIRYFFVLLLIEELTVNLTGSVYAQDSISKNFHIKLGVEIIHGGSFSWKSKDYEILPIQYEHGNEGGSIVGPYIAYGIRSDFYFKKLILSAGALISSERFLAYVPFNHGTFTDRFPHYDLDYRGKYLDIPLSIGLAVNENYEMNKTYLLIGSIVSFIFYERIRIYNSSDFYSGSGSPLANYTKYNYNQDVVSKKTRYNRTCVLFTLGREILCKRSSPIYFKIALTFISAPLDIQRNTSEIFKNSRAGIDLGFSYKIK